jgi:membrane protease YdiL (CAAX protease family)
VVVAARLVGVVLVYLAVLTGGELAMYFVALLLAPAEAQGVFTLVGLAVAEGAALVIVLVLWRLIDRKPLARLGLVRPGAPRRWLRGAAIAAVMMGFIVVGWYTLLDGATWTVNPDAVRATVVLVGGLVGFAIQGPAEEVLFRGYLLENIRAEWGVRTALIVTSITFGLFHAGNPAFGPLPLINLILFGAAMALYKLRVDDERLWGVFGIHTVWNWLQQVVFGLPNSGLASLPDNALFTVGPNLGWPAPITGGGFGPEGTLAASLVLLALIGVCLRRPVA